MADFLHFFDALRKYSFLQRALISAVIIGIICSLIGVFILLRKMVFLGQGIAHSAFAGAALGLLLGVDPLLTILLFSVFSAITIGYVDEKKLVESEVMIGVIFSFFMALAILFIGMMEVYSTDVISILFGNILIITQERLILFLIFSAMILLLLFMIKKELFFMTFDIELAEVSGVPVRFLTYLFLVMVSVTISVSLRAIGAILVFAMIITPAAAAYQWTYHINRMMILSVVFGVFSAVFGLYLSYTFDLPSGSTIVSAITAIFVISFLFSPKRMASKRTIQECPYCKDYLLEGEECQRPECIAAGILHRHIDHEISIDKKHLPKKKPTKHDH